MSWFDDPKGPKMYWGITNPLLSIFTINKSHICNENQKCLCFFTSKFWRFFFCLVIKNNPNWTHINMCYQSCISFSLVGMFKFFFDNVTSFRWEIKIRKNPWLKRPIFFKNAKLQERLLQHLKEWGTCATTRDKYKIQYVFNVLHIVNGSDNIIL